MSGSILVYRSSNSAQVGFSPIVLATRSHKRNVFKFTLSGLPEPPVDVEVAEGPTDGTLLITWLPVTINPNGTSNGAPVTGYVIYLDGNRAGDVEPGTIDQAIIDVPQNTEARPKCVVVRTKSGDKVSCASLSVQIPLGLSNKIHSLVLKKAEPSTLSTKLLDEPVKTIEDSLGSPKSSGPLANYSGYPELDSDIGPSELSDIAEEPEEGLTDSDDDRFTPRLPLSSKQTNRRKPRPDSVTSLNRWNKNGSENNLHLSSAM
jgi:hypothetical protein